MIGHFARMCKKPKNGNMRGRGRPLARGGMRRINLIEQDDSQSESSNEMNVDNMVLHVSDAGNQPFVLKGKINKEPFNTMIDSGSPITIFTQEGLRRILKLDVIFARPVPKHEHNVDYNNKPLKLLGFITVDVQVGKKKKNARILITRDGKRSLIGRDWLNQLNFRVGEVTKNCEYNKTVNNLNEQDKEIKELKKKFSEFSKQKGKIKGHKIKVEFQRDATVTQQKGRRAPLQLQSAVETEIAQLINEGHIRMVDKINDKVFIQTVVITVKKDKTVKVALEARLLNNAIQKDKYQLTNLDNLMDQVAEIINSTDEGEVRFTSLDLRYAYGQLELHPETAQHCNFQIIGGRATGTYAFNTGVYGLTTTPSEMQKIMDKILHNTQNTFTFFDDILIVTKGNKQQHLDKVEEVFKKVDEAGIRLKEDKCKIAQSETEWLGFKLMASGVTPIAGKVQAITDKLKPISLKDLRSFMGAINQMNRFIPYLAQLCANWEWKAEHDTAFEIIKEE